MCLVSVCSPAFKNTSLNTMITFDIYPFFNSETRIRLLISSDAQDPTCLLYVPSANLGGLIRIPFTGIVLILLRFAFAQIDLLSVKTMSVFLVYYSFNIQSVYCHVVL